jgi:hypothetical protein
MRQNQQDRKQWLAGLKPGDKVAVDISNNWAKKEAYAILEVLRTTKTQIITTARSAIDNQRFRLDTGYRLGSCREKIEPVTDRVIAVKRARELEIWLRSIGQEGKKTYPTVKQLEAMKKAYDEAYDEATEPEVGNGQ